MFTRRPQRTARELVARAGRIPVLVALASLSLLTLPSAAWAQKAAEKADDKSKNKVVVSENMTVDLHVKDEDLSNVLELLSIQTQKNIIASKSVSGKVTATLYNVTFYQALDAILHVNGFGYMESGNFIYVYTNDELKGIQASLKKHITKPMRLNYINADDAKEFVKPLLSKEGGEVTTNVKSKPFAIPDKAPVGQNDYALSDMLVVTDFEENIKAIEDLLKHIDTRPQQVLVEATILQTSLNEANAFGVDFSIIGDVNFLDFINTGGALSAANALIKGGTGAANQGFSPGDSHGVGVTSTVGNTANGPGGFKVGVIAGDVGIFVRMLDSMTDTVILSNPKILALNRQPARVLVGKRVGYLNTTQTETSTTQSVEFLDTGTQLYFRPFVSAEGEVRMELKPQVSSAEIRTITDSGGRAVTIPDEVTQEMVTNVNVRDGQTVVLGGLFTENSTFSRNQVPWVGDIPLIGNAFRGRDDSTVRSEIIFLITPTIVTDTMIAGAADRASADIERIRTGQRQGLLEFSREKQTDKLNVEAECMARNGHYEEALYNLQRSLTLNPNQPDAYRMRETITGERERWPNPSMLDSYVNTEVIKRTGSIPTSPVPQPHLRPNGSERIPMEKTGHRRTSAEETINLPFTEMPTVVIPGQEVMGPYKSVGPMPTTDPWAIKPSTTPATDTPGETPTTPATEPAPVKSANGEQQSSVFPSQPDPASTQAALSELINSAMSSNTPTTEPSSVSTVPSSTSVANDSMPSTDPWAIRTPMNDAPTFPAVNVDNHDAVAQPTHVNTNPTTDTAQPTAASSITVTQTVPGTNPTATSMSVSSTNTPAQPTYTAPVLSEFEKRAVAQVRKVLPGLRGQVELFSMMNAGQAPALGDSDNDGWTELVAAQLLKEIPANSYVGGENAYKVVNGEKPDSTFHAEYGWIFNPKTGKLWAAGFDASDRPLVKSSKTTNTVVKPVSKSDPKAGTTAGVETDSPNR